MMKNSPIHRNKNTTKTTWQVQSTLKEEKRREKINCTASHEMMKLGELEKESENKRHELKGNEIWKVKEEERESASLKP